MMRPLIFVSALLAICADAAGASHAPSAAPATVAARTQTAPSHHDAAKDVAIWLHPDSPQQSLLLGGGGTAGLEVFDLQGAPVAGIGTLHADLVDVRYEVSLGDRASDVVLVLDAPAARLHMIWIDPDSPQLTDIAAAPLPIGTEATGLCSYRSGVTGKLYALVSTDEGEVQQWELHAREGRLTGSLIRSIPLGRGAGHCVADDTSQQLFVAVETTGLWRVGAEPESDATPVQLDAIEPFGALVEEVKGLTIYRADAETAYLVALDVGSKALKVYALDGSRVGAFTIAGSGAIPAVTEAEGLALVAGTIPGFEGGLLAVTDEDNGGGFANYKLLAWQDVSAALGLQSRTIAPSRAVAAPTAKTVEPTVETEPVTTYGDAADDPAIWIHPDDPAQSLVIGTNKKSGLEVYGLDGRRLQLLPDGRMNNVDVRYDFHYRGERVPIVVASNRTDKTIAVYKVDATTRRLAPLAAGDMRTGLDDPYGLCLYHSVRNDRFYVFINDADSGLMRQWRIEERRGEVRLTEVRDIEIGSQAEGCVADDESGHVYVGEEDVAIWKYGAEPGAGSARSSVDTMNGGRLTADVEGLGIYRGPDGTGFLIASNQGEDNYAVYRLEGNNEYVGKFHIVANEELGIDGASETDGLDVTSAALGPGFPRGVLIVQDGRNLTPKDRQNFKLVPWDRIEKALGLDR
jgi:3-phytase